ncbi:MAG: Crp/Fnr family transcriptional regulator, partial [Nannocystaceae bacterium]
MNALHSRVSSIPIDRLSDADVLASLAPFRGLAPTQVQVLVDNMVRTSRTAKTVILREGEIADGLYIVLRGRVHLTRSLPGGREIILGSLGPGELFGETVAVEHLAMTSSAVASLPSEVARISGETIATLTREHPETLRGLMASLAARMSDVESI